MNINLKLLIAVLFGIGIASIGFVITDHSRDSVTVKSEQRPLYWVAPMDSNYRRDEPGLSPMGMELVPVYAESESNDQDGPGTVTISPTVVNNLGVRTAKVQLKALQSEVRTVGYVQFNQDQLVHIHPRVEGWIETLYVKAAGDKVEKGEPLYTLYSPQLVNAQEEFVLAVNRNNSVLIRAAKARLKALNVSDGFVERLQANKKVMQNITFYARQSGVMNELNIREGFYVKPGTSMMSIGQLDEVWVEAEVFERQAQLIKVGLPVTMTLDYIAGQSWRGRVDYIYPTLDAKNRTLRVRLRFNNQDHQLKPNMFAQVTINANAEQQLIVPKEAVIRTGSQDRVVVALGEGRFKSVAVELGRSDSDNTVILAGINADDEVVISAQFLLDSESSKSSDFKRMQTPAAITSVWGKGVVNSVMADHRMVNISHEPMDELDWPSMTMDFTVADSVDFKALQAGQALHFELTKKADNSYLISAIHIMDSTHMMDEADSMATVTGSINTIDKDKRIANISRGAIKKWNRGPATMDFTFAESVDLSHLAVQQKLTFTFSVQDGEFVIQRIDTVSSMQSHSGH
ncbi:MULTISPECIES: efflux RND transporter periplasmic adaptor subunit [unclassified Pseudoalteromonas]|uniref:efflux RND transporter periplasmic adaptor subunit n=1 Tax=unclassified Pseudoalteromonas TaxID=194690 RepID=UPI000C075CB2|nr:MULTISPECIES: efflux RND transporter periplasmic adaptor subunit [unclassified Pseudoalteromonas]MDP2635848.1 efflux RND transporter periplasmic adaptor subunit [Pseudoalteromonas sp. 1_MG-2023]PHN88739.1 efflux transporter periplasmic adaptor subunit [Pseudoalteromonas sp. 3D05]